MKAAIDKGDPIATMTSDGKVELNWPPIERLAKEEREPPIAGDIWFWCKCLMEARKTQANPSGA